MKKLYLLICLLLIPFVCKAGIVASGSVTQANAKKSLVDGSAFIDITQSNLVDAPSFEAGGTGGDFNGGAEIDDGTSDTFTGWTNSNVNDGNGDKVEATATASSGSVAVKLTKTLTAYVGIGSGIGDIAVTAGKQYCLRVDTRGDGTVSAWIGIYDRTNSKYILLPSTMSKTSTSYSEFVYYFTAPAGCSAIDVNFRVYAAGSAYIDNVRIQEAPLYPYAHADSGDHKHIFKLIDSNGLVAWGFVGASGGGETLGGELVTNGSDFTGGPPPTGWTMLSCTLASIAGGQTGNCLELTATSESSQIAYSVNTVGWTTENLYKFSFYVKSGTSGNEAFYVRCYKSALQVLRIDGTSSGSWVEHTDYYLADEVNYKIYLTKDTATVGTMLFDTVSLKPVTDCSTNGLHILSTKSGSVQNWAEIEAGFDYNDSTYTYEIRTIGRGASIW